MDEAVALGTQIAGSATRAKLESKWESGNVESMDSRSNFGSFCALSLELWVVKKRLKRYQQIDAGIGREQKVGSEEAPLPNNVPVWWPGGG